MEILKNISNKFVDLIKVHILCCINFYCTGDSFPEKDRQSLEVVTGWSTITVGVFLQRPRFRYVKCIHMNIKNIYIAHTHAHIYI